MIKMIMTDGSSSVGITAINWADTNEHLIPRINAEYGYRPKNNETYTFGKNIFKAITTSKIGMNSKKEDYCIEQSDFTILFITKDSVYNKQINKIIQNKCILLNKLLNIINLYEYDFCDIGVIVSLINDNNIEIINITGEIFLIDYEKKLLCEFLTIVYTMLKKENHDYTKYIAYNRD